MPNLAIDSENSLYYEYHPPASGSGCSFVFFNALTGDTTMWEAFIGPQLRAAGHGTLVYNMRGQADSPFSPHLRLDMELIVSDACRLLETVNPPRAVMVGLSIGGLFAARSYLAGAEAAGLVFLNTLRKAGPRLEWIGNALVRAMDVGGMELFRDLFLQLLMNEDWIAENRPNFLKDDQSYVPLDKTGGHYKLLSEAGRDSDWDLPYEALTIPALVVTGLQDHVFFEADAVAELFARLPSARRVDMPDSGHMIPVEQPEKLLAMLLTFAKEIA